MRHVWIAAAALALGAVVWLPESPSACAEDGHGAGAGAAASGEKDWKEHEGDLPFVVGYEKGMQQVEFTGRPPMYFFTATW